MLCIFCNPATFRPLAGLRTRSSSSYRYPSAVYPAQKWFSQSPKLRSPPRHNTLEKKLAAFTNHYAVLGLKSTATDQDMRRAFWWICKRFDQDMMRNVDSKEYQKHVDRPQFLKVKASYEFLLDRAKREPYDAEYNDIGKAIGRAKRRARALDVNKSTASRLMQWKPRIPLFRKHRVVLVTGLPPQTNLVDVVRALAEISVPVGRVIDAYLLPPSESTEDRAAKIEFTNDERAHYFRFLARERHFQVLGKQVLYCKIVKPTKAILAWEAPPDATRVLVIEGPRDHKLMTVSALGEFLDRTFRDHPWLSNHMAEMLPHMQEGCTIKDSTSDPDQVTIEWVLTTWRGGAYFVEGALRREYPELSVTYGQDPCEWPSFTPGRTRTAARPQILH